MEFRQDQHARLIATQRRLLAQSAQILLALDHWSLEAPMVVIEEGPSGTTARPGAVGQLSSWLEHLDPELDAFVHLRQAGVDFDRPAPNASRNKARPLKQPGPRPWQATPW